MLSNENLDREEILGAHREQTVRRMVQAEETILVVQDAMSLNYHTHQKMEGIGYIRDKTLGVTASGLVLGMMGALGYRGQRY